MSKSLCESCIHPRAIIFNGEKMYNCYERDVIFKDYPVFPCMFYERKVARKEAIKLMKISYSTLYAWIAKGLPTHQRGHRVYFKESELMNYKPRKVGRPRSINK